jgi:urease accessory protein
MKLSFRKLVAIAGTLALATTGVQAHTLGTGGGDLAGGMAHPFLGIDHLLAMIAVGLWAAQLGRKAVWQVPLAFVSVMVAGFGLARLGLGVSASEIVIVASVAVLGAMVAGAVRLPSLVGVALVSVFAVFHGYAHGVEMPQAGSAWAYAAGFVSTTAVLHLIGVGLGVFARRLPMVPRLGGAAIAATGVFMLGGL